MDFKNEDSPRRWLLLGLGDIGALFPAVAGTLALSPPQHPPLSWPGSAVISTARISAKIVGSCEAHHAHSDYVYMWPNSAVTELTEEPESVGSLCNCLKVPIIWAFSVWFAFAFYPAACKRSHGCLRQKKKKKSPHALSVIRSKQFDNEQTVPVSWEESKDTRYCSKRSRPVIKLDSYKVKSFFVFCTTSSP